MSGIGRFIVFEGGEGCGKSTQASLLAGAIGARLTREPGGTKLGEQIRDLLLQIGAHELHPRAELLLLAAARAQHVEELIIPTLRSGRNVVCDRFLGSTIAYQGYGRGLPLEDVIVASEIATQGLSPDVTILLDMSFERSLERRGVVPDRIEAEGEDFHVRVFEGFRSIAETDAEHWVIIDASGTVDEVERSVREVIVERFGRGVFSD
ncbi:MAG TPA: dTMP kinase [Acidimicrobiales bacterium]|nr:dTMP kinase [Acidimicrobiales bacterium]